MTATLNGAPIDRGEIQIPGVGTWWAEVEIADVDEPAAEGDRVTIAIGTTPLVGTVMAGGLANGRTTYRIAAGGGAWGRVIPRHAYHNDAGVSQRSIALDAAAAAGETLDAAAFAGLRTGPHFARAEAPASAVLNVLAPRNWHVGLDGVTRRGLRPATEYTGAGTITREDAAGRVIRVDSDDVSGLVPGVTFGGSRPATDVEITIERDRVSTLVYAGQPALGSRRLAAFARILDALDPQRKYRGTYEFRVVSQAGERLNLQPVRTSSGMPDLANVPVRPGMAGLRATVLPGERVLVCFADCDPSRPQVFAHEEPGSPGWMPLTLELGGPGALGVARMTDPVVAGPFAGTIVMGSLRVKASV